MQTQLHTVKICVNIIVQIKPSCLKRHSKEVSDKEVDVMVHTFQGRVLCFETDDLYNLKTVVLKQIKITELSNTRPTLHVFEQLMFLTPDDQ